MPLFFSFKKVLLLINYYLFSTFGILFQYITILNMGVNELSFSSLATMLIVVTCKYIHLSICLEVPNKQEN